MSISSISFFIFDLLKALRKALRYALRRVPHAMISERSAQATSRKGRKALGKTLRVPFAKGAASFASMNP